MALRVLLADESSTIKKVMQLALQDFAVEVKAVPVGVDVLAVAKSFKPDIVFADVLLQKRSGYDVAADVKRDPNTVHIPVVLMWSSFMDLDERAFQNCGANGRLEKPFDVENLRSLVMELVPRTQSQRLAHFLKFPATFVEPLQQEEQKRKDTVPLRPVEAAPVRDEDSLVDEMPDLGSAGDPTDDTETLALHTPTPGGSKGAKAPASGTASSAGKGAAPVEMGTITGTGRGFDPGTVTPSTLKNPAPNAPRGATQTFSTGGNWTMDSFESISQFSTQFPEGDADEDFSQVKIAKLKQGAPAPAPKPKAAEKEDALPILDDEATSPSFVTDDQEPWSHQDLSRFKLDLPPVDVESEEISLVFDLNDADLEGGNFLLNQQKRGADQAPPAAKDPAPPPARSRSSAPIAPLSASHSFEPRPSTPSWNDLGDEPGGELGGEMSDEVTRETPSLHEMEAAEARMHLTNFEADSGALRLANEADDPRLQPLPEPMALPSFELSEDEENSMPALTLESESPMQTLASGDIPNLSANRLEEIIRAQSKEIIEEVVKKIVPDIASDLIRKELDRLLKESTGGA